MEVPIATTPFGSRPMSLALLAAQRKAHANLPKNEALDKWQIYRDLCEGKTIVGVNDRSLAVLAALLSFYPDNELSEGNGLVVFPSNKQLSLRAHGMADATLRRHLAALLGCGLILRRDSANGKRFARKGRGGQLEEAFGFSLAPLLSRAKEFAAAAEQVKSESRALRLMRERVTLHRRDISKLIEAALQEEVPGDWASLFKRFRAVVDAIPRRASLLELEAIVSDLKQIRDAVDNLLNSHANVENLGGNESQYERQQSNSDTDSPIELEPGSETSRVTDAPRIEVGEPRQGFPLELVLKACPEIADYAISGIDSWRDLMVTASQVRGYLGISPSAYFHALEVLGQQNAAIVIACILQRAEHINSAGGYLRVLTEKARAGEFSVGPMLMATLKASGEPTKIAARMAG